MAIHGFTPEECIQKVESRVHVESKVEGLKMSLKVRKVLLFFYFCAQKMDHNNINIHCKFFGAILAPKMGPNF